ncbi:hypothetical protein TWF694_002594 [Orbilia ellipsospora]|uniref:Condensation domain-containing protein n=1 Tax=Orbilia ellipsospora TaxID=2528407 RepID=A0AAV9X3R8_9PEZI
MSTSQQAYPPGLIEEQQSHSKWEQKNHGVWERTFDPIEQTVNFMAVASPSKLQFVITVGAILRDPIHVKELQNAWLALRYVYPVVGSTITDTGLRYQVPKSERELQHWVDETTKIEKTDLSPQEVALSAVAPKDSRGAEIWVLPRTNELFLLIRHEICDGVGSLILLNKFLELLRENKQFGLTDFGHEHTNLSEPISKIMKTGLPTERQRKQVDEMATEFVSQRALGLQTKPLDPNPVPKSGRIEHTFGQAETASILAACKVNGITITHAATAAAAIAILEHSGEQSGRFCTVCHVNMRELLPTEYNRALGNLFTTAFSSIPVSKSSELIGVSEQVKQVYNWWKYNKDNCACSTLMPDIVIDSLTAAFTAGVNIPAVMAPIPLGVVEKKITEQVEDFWFNLTVSGGGSCMYIYTVKDRLRFVYCYDAIFHEDNSIKEFNTTVIEHLMRGLELVQLANVS